MLLLVKFVIIGVLAEYAVTVPSYFWRKNTSELSSLREHFIPVADDTTITRYWVSTLDRTKSLSVGFHDWIVLILPLRDWWMVPLLQYSEHWKTSRSGDNTVCLEFGSRNLGPRRWTYWTKIATKSENQLHGKRKNTTVQTCRRCRRIFITLFGTLQPCSTTIF